MASNLASIINGRPAGGPQAGMVTSPNPSRLTVPQTLLVAADEVIE